MRIVVDERTIGPWRGGSLVPTMGALHEGHLELIRIAARSAQPVVVSVFVNPTQFDEASDYERYPRMVEDDAERAKDAGAEAVFAPSVEVMYPGGPQRWTVRTPRVGSAPQLEDAARGALHFEGVAQVVSRLFELVRPRAAVFGEKDWQQLRVVSDLDATRDLGVEVVPGETFREPDGLAMSSRNRFIAEGDRHRALGLQRALRASLAGSSPAEGERLMRDSLRADAIEWDYACVRDAVTLEPWRGDEGGPGGPWDDRRAIRSIVAARIGTVRLLDNIAWTPSGRGEAQTRV